VIPLPPRPSAVPAARAHAQWILREWGFGPQLSEVVALCLSELVANAIQAFACIRGQPIYSPRVKSMGGDRHCTLRSRRYQPFTDYIRR